MCSKFRLEVCYNHRCYNVVVTTPYNAPPRVVTTTLVVTTLVSRDCNLSVCCRGGRERQNAGDLFNPSLEMCRERKCAIVRCVALVPHGTMYTRCECSRTVVAGCKCLCVGGFQPHNFRTPTSLQLLHVLCGLGCLRDQNQLRAPCAIGDSSAHSSEFPSAEGCPVPVWTTRLDYCHGDPKITFHDRIALAKPKDLLPM